MTNYRYDSNNRLTARNATVGTTTNASTFLWDGDTLTKEYNADGNVTKRYFGREAVYQNGHWHVLMSDHQGSIVGAANDQGQHEFTNLYADFGALTKGIPGVAAAGGIGTDLDYQWTGERMDRNTGFIYMRNRHYQPALGKFLQRDPIGYAGGMNVYSFASGDFGNHVVRWTWEATNP